MPSRKPSTPAQQPSTSRANRQAVLTGRIGKDHGSSTDNTSNKKYPKFIATMALSTGNNNNNNNNNSSNHPDPMTTTTSTTPTPIPTPTTATATTTPNTTAPATGTIPSPALGRPRGGASLDGGKYGRCPRCATGRRIRSRYNPHGASAHRGKFRFVCSTKAETGCDYSETLDDDPALCPEVFSGRGAAGNAAKGGGLGGLGGLGLGQGGGGVSLGMGGGGRMGRGTVLGMHPDEEEEEGDFEILGQSAVVTPSKAFGRRAGTATIARDKPPQNLGCPECMVGRLTKRRKDNFRFTETMLVCEKAWNGKDVVGGCGYQIDIGADPVEEGPSRGASTAAGVTAGAGAERAGPGGVSATVAKAREEIKKLKKKSAREIAREKKEMDEWTAKERARAMANPYAAAVMVAPNAKPKKKIVVDLTDDGEFSMPSRGPPGGSAVGAYAPIFIDDDDDEIARHIKLNRPTKPSKPDKLAKITKFDEFGSDDEMDLVRLAEEATEEVKDRLYEEDELALMELADQFSSPMPAN